MPKKHLPARYARQLIISLFLLVTLVAVRNHLDSIQTFFGFAQFVPADIVVDTGSSLGPMVYPWRSLAQGGEAAAYQFTPVMDQLRALKPEYIRLDHLYDFYEPVGRNSSGQLTYDWTKLDNMLRQITQSGAKPFLSLSYMPPVLNSGDVTGKPDSWNEWGEVVKTTIEHVSGRRGLNLTDVYYEVWNEPDLFGGWKTYGDKNYLTLYEFAARGAQTALNVNSFHFGGPATTALYDNWVTRFYDYVKENQLRVDFYSWHQYSQNPTAYFDDLVSYYKNLDQFPEFKLSVEPLISEWGFNSQNDPGFDNNLAAAHTVAAMSFAVPAIKHAFIFEFQDGKDPQGAALWGRWGLLTHQDFGSLKKPRYQALLLLNQLGDQRLNLVGMGTFVKGLAAQTSSGSAQVILTNYDPKNQNVEDVPVSFLNLKPGNYHLTTTFLGRLPKTTLLATTAATLKTSVSLAPNMVALLELSPQ